MFLSRHRSAYRALTIALAAVLLLCVVSHAQLPAPPATTEDALHQMLSQAGIVFAGQVTAVRRIASANGSTGVLEVDFAVDDAILGVAPNTTYTLREWAGSSPAGPSATAPQFEIARRYLMFLHAPGPSGLTSPVGGPDGAIPIVPVNPAAAPTTPDALGLAAQAAPAQTAPTGPGIPLASPRLGPHTNFRLPPASADATPYPISTPPTLATSTVDLRWIATHVLTPLAYTPDTDPFLTRTDALLSPSITEASGPTISLLTAATPALPPTSTATYATVLTMLRAWRDSPSEVDRAPR